MHGNIDRRPQFIGPDDLVDEDMGREDRGRRPAADQEQFPGDLQGSFHRASSAASTLAITCGTSGVTRRTDRLIALLDGSLSSTPIWSRSEPMSPLSTGILSCLVRHARPQLIMLGAICTPDEEPCARFVLLDEEGRPARGRREIVPTLARSSISGSTMGIARPAL